MSPCLRVTDCHEVARWSGTLIAERYRYGT